LPRLVSLSVAPRLGVPHSDARAAKIIRFRPRIDLSPTTTPRLLTARLLRCGAAATTTLC
jgi:hypothetical protein